MSWFICPYKWITELGIGLYRYCAMNDFTEQLRVDASRSPQPIEDHGGYLSGETPLWAECEFLGDRAIVKVHTAASSAMLAVLEAEPTFFRIPADVLDIALEDQNISNRDLNRMWEAMKDAGYTTDDISQLLGIDRWQDLKRKSLREFANTITSRWRRPKGWNEGLDEPEFENEDWSGGSPSSIEIIDDRIP